jgi:Na+/phosphate symporter
MLVYTMVWSLEQVADYINNIFNYITKSENKIKINKETLKIFDEVNITFKLYYETFYSFDSNKVSNLKEKCLNIINKISKQLEKNKSEDIITLLNLNLIAERLYHMTECLI